MGIIYGRGGLIRSKIKNPDSVYLDSNPVVNLDVSRTETLSLNGSTVVSITDPITGVVASQSTASAQPLYEDAGFNGRPCLSFDGANDSLQTGAIPALNTNTMTIFIVTQFGDLNTTRVLANNAYSSGAGTNSPILQRTFQESGNFFSHARTSTGGFVGSAEESSITPVVISFIWNGTTALQQIVNEVEGNVVTGANAVPSGHQSLFIGCNSGGSLFFLGKWCQYIAFNSVLTSIQITNIKNRLTQKWIIL